MKKDYYFGEVSKRSKHSQTIMVVCIKAKSINVIRFIFRKLTKGI